MADMTTVFLEQLHDPSEFARSQAALKLGEMADVSAAPELVAAIAAEPDLAVREDMTWALVRMADAAIDPLMALLRDQRPAARYQAAHVLGKIGDSRAVEALSAGLRDTDATVSRKAAFALSQIGDARAIPALVGLLGSDSLETQAVVSDALESFGKDALPWLIGALADDSAPVREQAADALGLIGDKAAIPALVEALNDPQAGVRFAVVGALGSIAGRKAGEHLASVQNDADARVRRLAQKFMGAK
jgi:HEAT repeat protein